MQRIACSAAAQARLSQCCTLFSQSQSQSQFRTRHILLAEENAPPRAGVLIARVRAPSSDVHVHTHGPVGGKHPLCCQPHLLSGDYRGLLRSLCVGAKRTRRDPTPVCALPVVLAGAARRPALQALIRPKRPAKTAFFLNFSLCLS